MKARRVHLREPLVEEDFPAGEPADNDEDEDEDDHTDGPDEEDL